MQLEVINNSLILPAEEYKSLEHVIDGTEDSANILEVAAFYQWWWNGESYCVYNAKWLRDVRGPAYIRHETTHWLSNRFEWVKGEVLSFALADSGFPLNNYEKIAIWPEKYATQAIWGNMIANIPFPTDEARRRFQMKLLYTKDLSYTNVAVLANKQFEEEGVGPVL